MQLDGNGWVQCGCGSRHWGTNGAAGLLLMVDDHVLLQLRPGWAHQGGTWAIPGGARDSHESVVAAALREAQEETALAPEVIAVTGVHRVQHPDWRYDTVLATAQGRPRVHEQAESVQLRWVPLGGLGELSLHPGFAAALPDLMLPPLHLVVDAANVVGSTPDGWWHDRVGATQRLLDRLEAVAGRALRWDGGQRLLSHVEVVVEGAARAIADPGLDRLVRVVRAPGPADDTIADLARSVGAVVVTSDRGLRERVEHSVPVTRLWEALDR